MPTIQMPLIICFSNTMRALEKIKDEMGRSLLRDEFYMDGLNCDPMSFDKECSLTNTKFHKNKNTSEIKSHHYIISFDPDDRSECGLTGEKAQKLCLDLAKKIFPGIPGSYRDTYRWSQWFRQYPYAYCDQ